MVKFVADAQQVEREEATSGYTYSSVQFDRVAWLHETQAGDAEQREAQHNNQLVAWAAAARLEPAGRLAMFDWPHLLH